MYFFNKNVVGDLIYFQIYTFCIGNFRRQISYRKIVGNIFSVHFSIEQILKIYFYYRNANGDILFLQKSCRRHICYTDKWSETYISYKNVLTEIFLVQKNIRRHTFTIGLFLETNFSYRIVVGSLFSRQFPIENCYRHKFSV